MDPANLNSVISNFSLFQTQDHLPYICLSIIYYWLFRIAYPYLPSFRVRYKLIALLAVRHRVRLDKLVGIIASLGTDSLHSGLGAQVNLQPLMCVTVLSNPTSSGGAMVPRLQPGTPGTIIVIVHGGSRKHRWSNTTILKTERNITGICTKIANQKFSQRCLKT